MNQQEFELIAEVFYSHEKQYGGRTGSVSHEIIEKMQQALADEYPHFDADKFRGIALYGYDDDGFPMCPNYGAKVLPNESNRCSLCNKHKAW